MYQRIVRSDEEIGKLLDQCVEQESKGGSKYLGMTYEQGIKEAIDWLTDKDRGHPLDE